MAMESARFLPRFRDLLRSLAVTLLSVAALPPVAAASPAEPEKPEKPPLRLVQPGAPNGLDPHLMDTIVGHSVLMNLFDGLVELDPEGRIRPALATDWESLDENRWRFQLRSGVRFHNGQPLRATDVVASLERAKDHPRSQLASYVAAIETVRATGDGAIEIMTRHPTPTLLLNLTNVRIVPAGAPSTIEHPVGTGAYRLLDYVPGHGVSLIAFDDSWRGAPPERRVDFFAIPDPGKRAKWLLEGRADVAELMKENQLAALEESPQVRVERQRSQEVFYIHLNPKNAPFDDRRLRCAVDLAIDRGAIARDVLGGRAEPAGQMVGVKSFGFSPDIKATAVDRVRARRLLEEAARDGDAVVTLILYHPHNAADVAEVLRQQLEQVGIRMVPRSLVWHEFVDLLQHAEPPAYLAGWTESTFDASGVFEGMVHSPDPERGFGDMNFTGYSRPAIDRRIESAAREMDPDKRLRLLGDISAAIHEDCAFLPLVWAFEHYGVARDLEWTPRFDGLLRAWDMRRRTR
ncbi:MAG: ABC transporter substrate-binding protein [Acidobacteriota bacterium]